MSDGRDGETKVPMPLFVPEGEVFVVPTRLFDVAGTFEHEATLLTILYALRLAVRPFARPRPFPLPYAEVSASIGCSVPSVSRGVREAVRRGILRPLEARRRGGPLYYEFCATDVP